MAVAGETMSPERRRAILARYAVRRHVLEERSRRSSVQLVEPPAPEAEPPRLTQRQVDVLELVAAGLATRELARALAISPHSVESHVRKAMDKLGAANRAHAVALAFRQGLLTA
jgi:DNA-binding NarL/FixJ family response regulator